jgi:hypothetical protein
MNKKSKLVILDIGSHKLEEIQLLLDPYPRQFFLFIKWFFKRLIKVVIKLDFHFLPDLKKSFVVLNYFFLNQKKFDLSIISIEPSTSVIFPYFKKISKKYKILHIPAAVLGHDSNNSFDMVTLYDFGDSLSSSIYKKDRLNLQTKNITCLALKLEFLWNELIKNSSIDSDSPVLLRMNCEGSELGVLKECEKMNINLLGVIGSLGDIRKIHGQESEDLANKLLIDMKVSYKYFKGDDPETWFDIIPFWDSINKDFVI